MSLEQQISEALKQSFAPSHLDVINESHLHAGHDGDDGSGESHWKVVIVSDQFSGLTRIAKHRAVHAALGKDILNRIHALSLDIQSDA
ncbi:BolA protein [Cognatiyoonia sediminum]|uniref:BolA protein n=1 Tax=Cognatiyoonia sediminum TaxID=1508389 RepID=A0A1M5LAY1_9RHOB|nr:BolA family protein [Cognatiyoonia sediminum]SHG62181.1 BolA protein [Cognatiyoonia sediminum]